GRPPHAERHRDQQQPEHHHPPEDRHPSHSGSPRRHRVVRPSLPDPTPRQPGPPPAEKKGRALPGPGTVVRGRASLRGPPGPGGERRGAGGGVGPSRTAGSVAAVLLALVAVLVAVLRRLVLVEGLQELRVVVRGHPLPAATAAEAPGGTG